MKSLLRIIKKKVYKHLAIDANQKITRELYWSQVFNFAIRNSVWLTKTNFNAGRWALGFPALYILYRILNDIKPKSILEFGLGESSKMTYQYANHFPNIYLKIIEQDKNWLDFFSNEHDQIEKNVQVLPLTSRIYNGFETNIYADLINNINDRKYDFILIDGPFGSRNYSRSQIIDITENDLLEENFIILFDDYQRIGEQQTAMVVMNILDKKNVSYVTGLYQGDKDSLIICSEKYAFLKAL